MRYLDPLGATCKYSSQWRFHCRAATPIHYRHSGTLGSISFTAIRANVGSFCFYCTVPFYTPSITIQQNMYHAIPEDKDPHMFLWFFGLLCKPGKPSKKSHLSRSHIQVGSLEVGNFHTIPIRAPISPLTRPYGSGMGALCETTHLQTTLL